VQAADVAIWVIPISDYERRHSFAHPATSEGATNRVPASARSTELASLVTADTLILFSKSDLVDNPTDLQQRFSQGGEPGSPYRPQSWIVSLKTGDGMANFLAGLAKVIKRR
jgi:hypothetical protein